ncbi:MAG: hypothetical protein LBP22_13645 [Deltaproteobacteria bacterium]|jgi:hypothetical protein|nr:hypothetical protein [Deltaproteobacteria bacterium]
MVFLHWTDFFENLKSAGLLASFGRKIITQRQIGSRISGSEAGGGRDCYGSGRGGLRVENSRYELIVRFDSELGPVFKARTVTGILVQK